MKRPLLLLSVMASISCGGSNKSSPPARSAESERYFEALDARYNGDTRAYYDGLLELAHDEPDSRAGRKARAVLQSDGGIAVLSSLGVASAIAIPSFVRFQGKGKEAEAKQELRAVYVAESAFFAEKKRYCRTFKECGYEPALRNYTILLGPREIIVPQDTDASLRGVVGNEALEAATQAGVKPRVDKKKFLAVAVANLDGDFDRDVWTIDEAGKLTHVTSDLE